MSKTKFKDVKYTITELSISEFNEENDGVCRMTKGESRYKELVDAFIESGVNLARIDLELPEETTVGEFQTILSGIKLHIKSRNLPIWAFMKAHDIYICKLDAHGIRLEHKKYRDGRNRIDVVVG